MKKLLILFLFSPLFSQGQIYKEYKYEYDTVKCLVLVSPKTEGRGMASTLYLYKVRKKAIVNPKTTESYWIDWGGYFYRDGTPLEKGWIIWQEKQYKGK